MVVLELILVLVLQFEEGISEQRIFLYYRPGHEAILPCTSVSSSDTTCSRVNWLYNRDQFQTVEEVKKGNIIKNSPRAARLSLTTNCSLVINNITAEDVGLYTCRQEGGRDSFTHLSVLTISPSPPDADPQRDGDITLQCSLLRYSGQSPGGQDRVRWVNETGTVLVGEGVDYKVMKQTNYVSVLTVKHQSGHNRRYTCQFTEGNNVKIEADYTLVFTDNNLSVTIGALVVAVMVLVIIAVLLIIYIKRTKVTEDLHKLAKSLDQPESNLTYITVSHESHKASPKKKTTEEEKVTYSTVKTVTNTEKDEDANHLYSCISTPQ